MSFNEIVFRKLTPKLLGLVFVVVAALIAAILLYAISKGYGVDAKEFRLIPPAQTIATNNKKEVGLSIKGMDAFNVDTKSFRLFGEFKKRPSIPVRAFVRDDGTSKYWPSGEVEFKGGGVWEAKLRFTNPPDLMDTWIGVMMVGSSAKVLYQYYEQVGEKTGKYLPINAFPPDATILDEKKAGSF